jgi:acetyl-CoA carboxylase biotin carboxylase subunit
VFRKILIANRGEMAVRVIRACWDLDIKTVAVYSTADRAAPHVRVAHEAYLIGPAPARESYLKIDRIIEVAKRTGAEAIHPGTGFLAENPDFAEACEQAGIVFIGPSARAMRLMGDKILAKEEMRRAGVPTLPSTGPFTGSIVEAIEACDAIGYPVIVKPASAGGGKGMRVCDKAEQVGAAIERSRSEARTSFGSDVVYIEKYLRAPRHVEIQVMFDKHGKGVHFGERECSIQRRHQKIVEECPSVVVDAATRAELGRMALAAGGATGYTGAGTVEFLRDTDGSFYFMEMNTRLQVEHTVTEQVYQVDLVQAQIRVAAGEPLPYRQEDLVPRGHAIECRITAEDPERNFMPCPGRIEAVRLPSGPGIRDDSAVSPGYTIPMDYDPMVAKLIAYGPDRLDAIRKMRRALDEYRLEGIKTNIPYLRRLMEHPVYVAGDVNTAFIDQYGPELLKGSDPWLDEVAAVAAAIHAYRMRVEQAMREEGATTGGARAGSQWLAGGRRRALRGVL